DVFLQQSEASRLKPLVIDRRRLVNFPKRVPAADDGLEVDEGKFIGGRSKNYHGHGFQSLEAVGMSLVPFLQNSVGSVPVALVWFPRDQASRPRQSRRSPFAIDRAWRMQWPAHRKRARTWGTTGSPE